jgi:plastocyanin
VTRRLALIAALVAVLLTPGAAAAATVGVTVTDDHYSTSSLTISFGNNVVWQSNNTNHSHTATADSFGLFNFSLPAHQVNSQSYTFDRAGGFGFHCQIHHGMRGTVNVQMSVDNPTPAVGQVITITFASSGAPSGFSEQIQKRKAGGTWKTIGAANTGTTQTWTPLKAKTFQFRARLVNGGVFTSWSPILSVTAH